MPKVGNPLYTLYNEDCFKTFQRLPPQSIDLVLADPPYGTTQCKWDSIIPLEPLWKELKRVAKPNAAIVLMAGQPFTSVLVCSNLSMFRYRWVWVKGKRKSGHYDVKLRPLRIAEEVVVFGIEPPRYFPQMTNGVAYTATSGQPTIYGKGQKDRVIHKGVTSRFPVEIIDISPDDPRQRVHPAQKPVALMEYLISTYSTQGDTVLDFTMGSGTTGVACGRLGRRFLGCDKDTEHGYFGIAQERIANAYRRPA